MSIAAISPTPLPTAQPAGGPATHPHPLALRPADLAARLGTSRRNLYNWLKSPDPDVRLPTPFKIGRATFWRTEEIETWLARQAQRRAA